MGIIDRWAKAGIRTVELVDGDGNQIGIRHPFLHAMIWGIDMAVDRDCTAVAVLYRDAEGEPLYYRPV